MKKFFALLMCVAMVFSVAIAAQAASNPYEVKELEMTMEIPDTFEVETKAGEENTYLVATANDGSQKITVTMVASEAGDLQDMNRTEQSKLASGMYATYEEQGLTVSKYNLYSNQLTSFIRCFYNNGDKTLCGIKYYTVLGGKQYEITLEKNGEIGTDDELMFRGVVDSAVIGAQGEPQTTDTTEASGETQTTEAGSSAAAEKNSLVLPIAIGCGVLVLIVVVVVVLKKKGNKK